MSILAGAPKAGKSNLVRGLLYSLSTGDPWLGHDVPTARQTVYYCLEDPEAVFKQSMKKLFERSDAKRPMVFAPIEVRFSVNPSHILQRLKEDVSAGAALIIIDTLFKVLDVEDSNNYAQMAAALDTLSRFAKNHHVHLLLLHHLNKASSGKTSSLGILGSTAIPGAPDCNIILARNEQDGQRNLYSENRIPDFLGGSTFRGEQVNFDKETGYVWLSRPITKEQKRLVQDLEVLSKIWLLLWEHPAGLSKKEIEENVTGIDDKIKREQLKRGLELGLFAPSPTGKKGGHPLIIIHPNLHWRKEDFQEAYKQLTGESCVLPTDEE